MCLGVRLRGVMSRKRSGMGRKGSGEMIVYKIDPKGGLNPVIEKRLQDVLAHLQDSVPGDKWEITVMDMTEEEYEALPEWVGY